MDSLVCPLCCSTQFQSKNELIEHLRSVNSNLKCPICKQQAADLSSLISHLQNQCSNDSQISLGPNSVQTENHGQYSENGETYRCKTSIPSSSNSNSAGNAREKVILMRKRKRSNITPLSSRRTFGKNNSSESTSQTVLSTTIQYEQETNPSTSVESSVVEDGCQRASNPLGIETNQTLTSIGDDAHDPNTMIDSIEVGSVSQPTNSSTAEQTAESEIDLDNISMLSDESSFTTNDYSSSQNEILSDEDYTENAVGVSRRVTNPSRHVGVFRNNAGNHMFINNLEVINNNFYTIVLNNGSYEGNTPTPSSAHERNGNYQRRNTKNNNSQFNNNCNTPADHTNVPHSVSMHNNLQGNRSSKNSNLTSVHNATAVSSAPTLPGASLFKVSNSSPNKYAVKNTNITNYIPTSSKEVTTANLENRTSARSAVLVENASTSEDTTQATQDTRLSDEIARVDNNGDRSSPVNENVESDMLEEATEHPATSGANALQPNHHPVISRSSSSRMQKIQNVDCIQNSTSSLVLNPSTSALCKTNSFPLCNYIRTQDTANKCKLIKYNGNASGKLSIASDNEVLLNNIHPVQGCQNTMSMLTNDIASDEGASPATGPSSSNQDPQSTRSQNNLAVGETDVTVPDSEVTNVYDTPSLVIDKNVCTNSESSKVCVSLGPALSKSRSLDINQPPVSSTSAHLTQRSVTTSMSLDLNAQNVNYLEGEVDDLSVSSTFQATLNNSNNLNNNLSTTIPSTTQNICSLNNNLHRNKKSNLNQLGRRNVGKEEKLFTIEKEPSVQQSAASTSEANANSSYQMINNSIERNFNKLNTCSQEINAHKNVKSSHTNRKHKKSKKPLGSVHNADGASMPSCSSHSVANLPNTVESTGNDSVTASNSSRTENTTSTNLFQDMSEQMNNSASSSSKVVFNNKHHSRNTDSADKTISKMFNKKDLLNIKRNNFDFGHQEHSNVKRSNSLHVKINDLASGASSSTQPDGQQTARRSITKSNSFTIRNNISESGPSQGRSKKQNYAGDNNSKENCLKDLKNNINRRLENVEINADGSDVLNVSDDAERTSYSRDALEPFRLEEATNDIPAGLTGDGENDPFSTQLIPGHEQLTFSGGVLNNSVESVETHALNSCKAKPGCSSNGGSAAGSSPRMIHNNIEPRCKKNKKCNEEREPLKPINSENKRKPADQ